MDTSDPLSLNLYTYCCNNPVMYVDPSGNYGEAAIAWTSSMWWLIGADFALPIGDIIYVAGVVTCAIIDLVNIVHIENAAQAIDGMSQIIRENGQSIIDKTGSGNNESGSNSNSSPEPPNNNWNHRDKYLNQAENENLKKAIDQIYRKDARIGDGGTADMLRYEYDNDLKLNHLIKATERITQLNRILETENLSIADQKLAHQLLNDLYNAVKYVKGQ